MVKRLILAFLFFSLICCVIYRLEKKLSAQNKEWYFWHEPILCSEVPKEYDWQWRTEQDLFLHLPPEVQTEYIKEFWDLRDSLNLEGKEDYEQRIKAAKALGRKSHLPGYLDHRGRLILQVGFPFSVTYCSFDEFGNLVPEIEEDVEDIACRNPNKVVFQVFSYWYPRTSFLSTLVQFVFHYDYGLERWVFYYPLSSNDVVINSLENAVNNDLLHQKFIKTKVYLDYGPDWEKVKDFLQRHGILK